MTPLLAFPAFEQNPASFTEISNREKKSNYKVLLKVCNEQVSYLNPVRDEIFNFPGILFHASYTVQHLDYSPSGNLQAAALLSKTHQ